MARASLGTINPATTSGTALAALLSSRDAAENSGHSGTGRPSYATEGMLYAESSFDPVHIFLAGAAGDGSEDVDLTSLFAPRPGTIRETAEVRLTDGWLWADGSAILRGDYPELLDAIAPSFTGTTNGTTTISSVSEDLRNLGLVGSKIEGTDIPVGATITAITATSITISAAATGSHAGVTLRAFPHGNGNGSTTFNTPNRKGRVAAGRGDMGGSDVALITTGGAGFDGKNLGASGGQQTFQLLTAHLPAHSHSASTSGSTDTHAGHTHGPGTYVTDNSGSHTHSYLEVNTSVATENGANRIGLNPSIPQSTVQTGAGGNHNHNVTGGASASGGSHSHVLTLSTSVGSTGSDTAHLNVQPTVVSNFIVKT